MINLLNLSRTCVRFCKLVNKLKRVKNFLKNCKNVTHFSSTLTVTSFSYHFKKQLYGKKVIEYTDQFYLDYVLNRICLSITTEKILAHMFYCLRNRHCFDCHLCIKSPGISGPSISGTAIHFVNRNFYNELWNKKIELVFSEDYCYQGVTIIKSCVCDNIENINSLATMTNFYGVITIRIFFNIVSEHISKIKIRNKEVILNFFRNNSKTLFDSLCSDINHDTIDLLIKDLKPRKDYKPQLLKISNVHYVDYLKCL